MPTYLMSQVGLDTDGQTSLRDSVALSWFTRGRRPRAAHPDAGGQSEDALCSQPSAAHSARGP